MPRRIVAVGLGIALAGLFLTAYGASVGRVGEQAEIDPTRWPRAGPDVAMPLRVSSLVDSPGPTEEAAVARIDAIVSARLELAAFRTAASLPPPPPPPMPPPPPPPPPTTIALVATGPGDAGLEALRLCESGGNYSAVSPGGSFRGAYQFSQGTWDSVATRWRPDLVGLDPAVAAPADQDALARALYEEAGTSPWPHCGRYL